jgi:hypothetical protein
MLSDLPGDVPSPDEVIVLDPAAEAAARDALRPVAARFGYVLAESHVSVLSDLSIVRAVVVDPATRARRGVAIRIVRGDDVWESVSLT